MGQSAKVEPGSALADASVSDAVKKTLDAKGYHVTLGDGSIRDLWLRDKIPAQTKRGSWRVVSATRGVDPGSGDHLSAGGDRLPWSGHQTGRYTLRYELIPEDGDHLGVSENRDFLLMIPASADQDPDAVIKFTDLVNLSRKATREPASCSHELGAGWRGLGRNGFAGPVRTLGVFVGAEACVRRYSAIRVSD